jgi:hypothetical protein
VVLDQGTRVVKYDLEGRLLGVVVDLRSDAMRAKLGTVDPGACRPTAAASSTSPTWRRTA